MVAIGNDTDEMAPHLVRFMAAVGAGGDIPTRVRRRSRSPDGIGAQIAAVHARSPRCSPLALGWAPRSATRCGMPSNVGTGAAFRMDGLETRCLRPFASRLLPRCRGPHADARASATRDAPKAP
jgi:hypothetical protein